MTRDDIGTTPDPSLDDLIGEVRAAYRSGVGGSAYVYVARSRYMPGLCKIGFTTREPAERVAELSRATGTPGLTLYRALRCPSEADAREIESAAHARLEGRRVEGKEWFQTGAGRGWGVVRAEGRRRRRPRRWWWLWLIALALFLWAVL